MVRVWDIDTETYSQNFVVSEYNKKQFGEINTSFDLINRMLDLFPESFYKDPNLRWLDPCCGCGYFTIVLFHRLFKGLQTVIPSPEKRKKHIIQDMIYMIEINKENYTVLKELFGKDSNIINFDFLSTTKKQLADLWGIFGNSNSKNGFHAIIGNPPYNSMGSIKVPTNKKDKKTGDGKTVWRDFVKTAISFLCDNTNNPGYLNFIIPSIWMKPDKERMYHFLTQYKIEKMHCFTNTETNRMFHGEAQTPTCYFLLQNTMYGESEQGEITELGKEKHITLYDKQYEKYVDYKLLPEFPIPVFGASIIRKLIPYVETYGHIEAIKTNEPSRKAILSADKTELCPFPNIVSAVLKQQEPVKIDFKLVYSDKQLRYSGMPKLILAHKMYGFPVLDWEGKYGIGKRDNYVIIDKSKEDLSKIRDFLSTYFALYVFESTRYRMKYLEKYAFQFLPDITKIGDFPDTINDKTIANTLVSQNWKRNLLTDYTENGILEVNDNNFHR